MSYRVKNIGTSRAGLEVKSGGYIWLKPGQEATIEPANLPHLLRNASFEKEEINTVPPMPAALKRQVAGNRAPAKRRAARRK